MKTKTFTVKERGAKTTDNNCALLTVSAPKVVVFEDYISAQKPDGTVLYVVRFSDNAEATTVSE